ncbi:lysophospholipid acyltransferase family protein [Corynebacterium tapiri]|uniref:1-acyl-sn-glycerol-3-phosphate acyltransferase n=1 Tax=Corynebacterium tapiri TaxID=1448266 RepID=A0A5C4U1E1_9CORY|nr:lysophospholipid acyltransferase family protein [Corynebacterium tapiri]TNL95591.1 1-acyl-sn-glycerol-3-phosphate acyltransferase [Corynebacterium tapiri]
MRREGQFRVPQDFTAIPEHPVEAGERPYGSLIIPVLRRILRLQGIDMTVVGAEHIPAEGPALIASNHTNYYDFIFAGVPAYLRGKRLVRFMAKKEVFEVPVVGALMRAMKHVSVDRSAGKSSISDAISHLNAGELVGIFPEATISRSFELKDFKTGAVRIATEAGVPLIPLVTWGGQRVWTKGGKLALRPRVPVHIQVGEPVDTSGTPEEATQRLKDAMQELLVKARSAYEDEHGPFPGQEPWRPAALGGGAPTLEEANEMDRQDRERKAAKREAQK